MLLIIAIAFLLFFIALYLISPLIAPEPLQLQGAHVLITGGSSGIGKAIAVEVAKKGANVTLLARNQAKLLEAATYVEDHRKNHENQKVQTFAIDLCKEYATIEATIKQAQDNLGPVDMLFNCAGLSLSGRFDEIPLDEFKRLLDINYMGSVYATRALIGGMKERKQGRIVFVSSQAGQLGLYGFTAYSASKFALRGLAESLQMEVKQDNIYVSLAFPPDTDTPGYETEMLSKPKETKLISDTSGLFQPAYVAQKIVADAVVGKFLCHVGLDGYMLAMLTCGMSPVISITEATQQVLTMGVFRAISLLYLDSFDRIVRKCKREDTERLKEKTH